MLSLSHWFLWGKFCPEILTGSHQQLGVKQGWGGKAGHFLAESVPISQTVGDTSKNTINN